MMRIILFLLCIFTLVGCATKVVSDRQGIVTIKGPRVAWGPGHDTYTVKAQENADEYCRKNGRDKAYFIGGEVRLFDGDYNKFTCTVSDKKIMKKEKMKTLLGDISICIRKNILDLDDLSSDAKTIAEGIAAVCTSNINLFLDAYLDEKKGNNFFNNEFRKEFKRDQYSKILPFVLKWRQLIKQGRNNSERPTENEMPNSLLQI